MKTVVKIRIILETRIELSLYPFKKFQSTGENYFTSIHQ